MKFTLKLCPLVLTDEMNVLSQRSIIRARRGTWFVREPCDDSVEVEKPPHDQMSEWVFLKI